jgi:DNA helicase HerA-like ATPase
MEEVKQFIDKQKKETENKKFGCKINIFGSTGAGKTYKTKQILKYCFKKPFVYRVTDDYDDLKVMRFRPDNIKDNLDIFIKMIMKNKGKIDVVVFDEADIYFPNNGTLTIIQKSFFDKHRHLGISIILISRRPQNINTLISEEAHFEIVFPIEGDNAKQKFNRISKGYGDLISSLKYGDYSFTFKRLGFKPEIRNKNDKI